MNIATTIIPIFAVIILGWFARWKGFIPTAFLEPANRLVYYLALPAMIFLSISKASLKTEFNIAVLLITLFSVLVVFAVVWGVGLKLHIKRRQLGTLVQCSFHGNLGYIGLAVAYYFLGTEGFVRAGIIAGFVIILQNFLAVVILQLNVDDVPAKQSKLNIVWKILGNPIILAAIAGIMFSMTEIRRIVTPTHPWPVNQHPLPAPYDVSATGVGLPPACGCVGRTGWIHSGSTR